MRCLVSYPFVTAIALFSLNVRLVNDFKRILKEFS